MPTRPSRAMSVTGGRRRWGDRWAGAGARACGSINQDRSEQILHWKGNRRGEADSGLILALSRLHGRRLGEGLSFAGRECLSLKKKDPHRHRPGNKLPSLYSSNESRTSFEPVKTGEGKVERPLLVVSGHSSLSFRGGTITVRFRSYAVNPRLGTMPFRRARLQGRRRAKASSRPISGSNCPMSGP